MRILGICLVAVFAAGVVTAASATAEEFRFEPPGTKALKIYKNCPTGNPLVELCTYATTTGGATGGQFTVGPITVPLTPKLALQFGDHENSEGILEVIAPENGQPLFVAPRLSVPEFPVAHISAAEQEALGWTEELKNSYNAAKHHPSMMKAYEQLELAGTPHVNTTNLIFETGTGVEVPLKIKAENPWIESLGDECTVASPEEPIVQHLTTGSDTSPLTGNTIHGSAGELFIFYEGEAVSLEGSDLVDNTFTVPAAHCTGPNAEIIAATIDKVFGLPAVAGASVTELKGSLHEAVAAFIAEKGI